MVGKETYFHEAEIISRYLLKLSPTGREKLLYAEAMDKLHITLEARELKIWNFVSRNPWALGPVDAALAIKTPHGNVRRKLFVMLAILEASPRHTEYFLARRFSLVEMMLLPLSGVRAALRLAAGIVLISFL